MKLQEERFVVIERLEDGSERIVKRSNSVRVFETEVEAEAMLWFKNSDMARSVGLSLSNPYIARAVITVETLPLESHKSPTKKKADSLEPAVSD